MYDAATCMSVESVVESRVSVYEAISNDRAEQEICPAVNGPLLQNEDVVIRAALREI
jgi:hypothetical protein